MTKSRPEKEEKFQSVTGIGLFSDSNKDQTLAPVTTQLLRYSCVPFSFAQLFTKIIKENKPDLPLKDLNKTLRLFEIGIYPEIWKNWRGESDENKSFQYMLKYLNKGTSPEIITEQTKIQSISPSNDTIWFVLGKTSEGPHVAIVLAEGNKFICEGKPYDYLLNTLQDITKVYTIEKTNLNIQLIHESAENYYKAIKKAFSSGEPLCSYYAWSLLNCCPFFSVKESFPEASKIITEQFIQNPRKYSILGRHMGSILDQFPDCRKGIEKILLLSPETCFESFEDIEMAATIFKKYLPTLSERVLLKQPEKFLRSQADVEKAISIFPDDEEEIREAAKKCEFKS